MEDLLIIRVANAIGSTASEAPHPADIQSYINKYADVHAYLEKHYKPDDPEHALSYSMMLENAAEDIVDRACGEFTDISIIEMRVLREAYEMGYVKADTWKTNHHDNAIVSLPELINAKGFLTDHEKWHSAGSRLDSIYIYRGCAPVECDRNYDDEYNLDGNRQLGHSWTLNKDLAWRFAFGTAREDGKVMTARLNTLHIPSRINAIHRIAFESDDAVWLDNPESEILWLNANLNAVIEIESMDEKVIESIQNCKHYDVIKPSQVRPSDFDLRQKAWCKAS